MSPRSTLANQGVRLNQGLQLPQIETRSHSRQSPFDYFPQLKAHAELQPKDLAPLSPSSSTQLRSCLTGSQPPCNEAAAGAESAWELHRKKTSADLRQWAVEQSKKQQSLSLQALALSGIRATLEVQSGQRNRSLDLVKADVKNIRLSFDSTTLPKDEKLRCAVLGVLQQLGPIAW